MRIGIQAGYAGDFRQTAAEIRDLESAGLDIELAAEIAEKWEPIFFHPERAADVWGAAVAAGRARRDPALGELDVVVGVPVAIGEDVEHLVQAVRPSIALYVGGMGAKGKNFYNDLARRYGYEAEAQT